VCEYGRVGGGREGEKGGGGVWVFASFVVQSRRRVDVELLLCSEIAGRMKEIRKTKDRLKEIKIERKN
jgi:hypothetical protein